MVPIEQLNVGDKVRIVDEWTEPHQENGNGRMDHWLSKVMTVREIEETRVRMEEDKTEFDGDGWFWFPEMLDEVVSPAPEAEFRIGDRVAANTYIDPVKEGDTGVVVDSRDHLIGVCWDRRIRSGHNCSDTCEDGHGWYVPRGVLRLDEPEEDFEIDAAVFDSMFL